jgi:hypothetical protein
MKKIVKFILTIIIFGVILFALYFINNIFKIINIPVNQIEFKLIEVNNLFFIQIAAGVTVGTILLLIFIFILPFFTKKINTKEYIKNIILGVIASFVFFLSNTVYQYFEKFGKFYVLIAITVTVIVSFLIIELMTMTFNSEKKGIEFRTAVLGCIASGLIFGIVLNLVLLLFHHYFKTIFK